MKRKINKKLIKNNTNPIKNKGGRPRIEVAWKLLDSLLVINCTAEEVCTIMNLSEDTLDRRLREHYKIGFAEFIKRGNVNFKRSLKRLQFQTASGFRMEEKFYPPNAAMQMFLGKQYLGQSDKVEQTGTPVDIHVLLDRLDEYQKEVVEN